MRLVGTIALVLLSGCGAPVQQSQFAVLSEGAATPLELKDLLPPPGITSCWSSVEADGVTEITCALTATDGTVNYRGPAQETQHLVEADGGLALALVESPRDDAVTSFDPPLLAYPERLAAEWTDAAAAMQVDYSDPARGQRDVGQAKIRSRVSRTARVRTPMGEFDTVVIESIFTANLRLATAENVAELFVAPGIGPVAEVLKRRVWVLGLPIQSRDAVVVRRDAPPVAEGGT